MKWTNEEKNKYAYDQYIGVDVLNKSNRSKSDKGPSEWLPDKNISAYCYSWLVIASKYNIAMRKVDIKVCELECKNDLEHCEMINKLTIKPEDITKK